MTLVFLLFCLTSTTYAQTSTAESKLMADKLLHAMSSNNYDTIKHFTLTNLSQETLDQVGRDMYTNYLSAESHFHGSLRFHSIEMVDSREGTINSQVTVKSKNTDLWYQISLSVTQSKPHKISSIRIETTENTTLASVPILTEQVAVEQLEKYIDTLSESGVFSGSVMITKGNNVLIEKAAGQASKRFSSNNTIQTRFNLGSMNKMFTSIAILKLVETGKISLTDDINKLLKIKGKATGFEKIQLQHLLSHSSGVGRIDCDKGDISIVNDWQTCMTKIIDMTLNFTSGSRFSYSNDGMFILGLIIEQTTGKTYDQYTQEVVLTPAKMTRTANLDLQFPVENAAIGYSFYGKQNTWRNNLFIHDKKGGPAGGGYSTVGDLNKFASALLSYKLLSKAMTDKAITAKTEFGASQYGFGFGVWQQNGKRVIGHNGAFPGVSSQLNIHLDSDYVISVLSNHSFGANPIIAKIDQLFNL